MSICSLSHSHSLRVSQHKASSFCNCIIVVLHHDASQREIGDDRKLHFLCLFFRKEEDNILLDTRKLFPPFRIICPPCGQINRHCGLFPALHVSVVSPVSPLASHCLLFVSGAHHPAWMMGADINGTISQWCVT